MSKTHKKKCPHCEGKGVIEIPLFGAAFREKRLRAMISAKAMAFFMGISPPQLNFLETQAVRPWAKKNQEMYRKGLVELR